MFSISLRDLSKQFVLSGRNRRPLYRELLHLMGRGNGVDRVTALDGITLDVAPGQRIALVGPNGAGKTTLLRTIAGIYRHTAGTRELSGRVACFFEAGAGMAPTLSVVDNISLYGAIVGLSRAEARNSLDEILDFAELGDHRHSRVEHLSFGMQQRLFFSVMLQTMHLRKADIFLFDEWLAGADLRFKDKGERMLRSIPVGHTTVIYASHDLTSLERMCERAIYLREGRLRMYGDREQVFATYREECGA